MKRLLLVCLFLLVSCGAPNLSAVDLEPVLVQSGDLPSGQTGSQVRDMAPGVFDSAPPPVKAIDQRFQEDGKDSGGVAVLLYEAPDKIESAYVIASEGMDSTVNDVGERAMGFHLKQELFGVQINVSSVAFTRCAAVVSIRFTGELDEAVVYAKRLDKRIQPLVC